MNTIFLHGLLTLGFADPVSGVAATTADGPLFSAANLIALLTLSAMEIVLGIDNIVFIAIIAARLPEAQRGKARKLGLALALITRILLLFTLTSIMGLAKKPLFTLPLLEHGVTGKDLILIAGGLFLIAKATFEVHKKFEGDDHAQAGAKPQSFWSVIGTILVVDLVFSVDSVVTAVGMARNLWIMVAAVVISIAVMLAFAGIVTRFIDRHPTIKMLALSFLLLIGVFLVADGLGQHIEKGYIYFAMAFSLGVEMLNLAVRSRHKRAGPTQH